MQTVICLESLNDIECCADSEALVVALRSCAADLLANISRMAAIVKRLEELGASIEIDHALFPYIRMIAHGQLSAQCFVAVAADPALLEHVQRLPIPLQGKFANNEAFDLVTDDGSVQVNALDMTRRQLRQLFKDGRQRTEDEQRGWLKIGNNKSVAQRSAFKEKYKSDPTRPLPGAPGGKFTKPGERCPGCGAKLLTGAECVACQVKGTTVSVADEIDDDDAQFPSGWQERMAELRHVKEHGNELGFHVDWLLAFLDQWDGSEGSQTLLPLYEKLAVRFSFETA